MATQSRGAPYPLGTDANNTAADLQALALWVNDRPGAAALTTTQRNALTGVDRWDGKLVLDTTLDRLFRWDAGTTTWIQIAEFAEIAALLATAGTPAQDGLVASRGVSAFAARADHVHPEPLWAAYTPALVGGFVGGAGAVFEGRWVRHGNTVQYWSRVTFGTGFTIGNGIGLTLPVNARSGGQPTSIVARYGSSGSNAWAGEASLTIASLNGFVAGTNGVATVLSATNPFTWKATDTMEYSGSYEAA